MIIGFFPILGPDFPPASSSAVVSESAEYRLASVSESTGLALKHLENGFRHRFLFDFSRIHRYRGKEAAAYLYSLDDIAEAHEAASEDDHIYPSRKHRSHLTDGLAYLIDHRIPHERGFSVAFINQSVDPV